MGAYVTATDAKDMLRRYQIKPSSILSDADIEVEITAREAEVDGALKTQGYTVPITDATDIALLKQFIVQKIAVYIWMQVYQAPQLPDYVRYWNESYDQWLKDLRKGLWQLKNTSPVTRQNEELQVGSFWLGNIYRLGDYSENG